MAEVDREAFTRCWLAHAGQVRAYASRHVGLEDAGDVVAETFLQAWRRWSDVPEAALPWLIGTARKVIGNRRRSERRREALAVRVALLDGAAKDPSGVDLEAETRRAAVPVDDQGRWAVELPGILAQPTRVEVAFLGLDDTPLGEAVEAIDP
ncbi:RNA polymerase sigma factor [Nocardioides sp. SR21]|uniref:RNA polymerase sigma factor n=1 Tax=Nocardioides sp. SR21 TaxID=2919501 RepID=UPI001FAB0D2B|nr:sigma factor [Nocardioides sp. SR21]